jgi:hypothetical protein
MVSGTGSISLIASKETLRTWIVEVLEARDGRATLLDVGREIWAKHENELRQAGDLFYTWQYDMRWAATDLRQRGIMRSADASPRGVWELAERFQG